MNRNQCFSNPGQALFCSVQASEHNLLAIPATPPSQDLWQLLEQLEQEAACIDAALRRTWLFLGGCLLPCAGLILYTLGQAR